jgi:hypothetical protein
MTSSPYPAATRVLARGSSDSYMPVDGSFRFFANGQPIPDVFFREDSVKGINVLSDNIERDSGWRRY